VFPGYPTPLFRIEITGRGRPYIKAYDVKIL